MEKFFIPLPTIESDGKKSCEVIRTLYAMGASSAFDQRVSEFLERKDFDKLVTRGVIYHPVVVNTRKLPEDRRTVENICHEAISRGATLPPLELAHLLCLNLSNEEIDDLGFKRLIVMHKPINSKEGLIFLGIKGIIPEYQFYGVIFDENETLDCDIGLVFLSPEVIVPRNV